MIENVGFVSHKGFVPESSLHRLDASLILLEVEIGDTLLIEHLWVLLVDTEGSVEVINRQLVLTHVKETLRSILQKLNVMFLGLNRFIELLNSFIEVT